MIHPATQFQFARIAREFAQWRAIAADQRSSAPAWWWSPALAVRDQPDTLPEACAQALGLPSDASYAAAALTLLDTLASQRSLPWPGEFPRRFTPAEAS